MSASVTPPLGALLHGFFADHLICLKGLRPATVRSYRDTVRLLLIFVAADNHTKITRLSTADFTPGVASWPVINPSR
jgi:hypothetical protein